MLILVFPLPQPLPHPNKKGCGGGGGVYLNQMDFLFVSYETVWRYFPHYQNFSWGVFESSGLKKLQ